MRRELRELHDIRVVSRTGSELAKKIEKERDIALDLVKDSTAALDKML